MDSVDKKNHKRKSYVALLNNGIDLAGPDKAITDGKAIYGAISDLAQEAMQASCKRIADKANIFNEVEGLTTEALDQMIDFEDTIKKQEKESKRALEAVRSLKSAMALELKTLSKTIKQVEELNVEKLATDLERIQNILENKTLRKLFEATEE